MRRGDSFGPAEGHAGAIWSLIRVVSGTWAELSPIFRCESQLPVHFDALLFSEITGFISTRPGISVNIVRALALMRKRAAEVLFVARVLVGSWSWSGLDDLSQALLLAKNTVFA